MTATKTAASKAAAAKTAPKAKAAPVVITAAKGGDQTVAPREGAIRAAVEASGKSVMAISREHGLNPSQLRRLTFGQVAKVDLPRAEAIATALGADLGTLFEAPVGKARAARAAGPGAGQPA